jgi:hypothetical protein
MVEENGGHTMDFSILAVTLLAYFLAIFFIDDR